MGEGAAAKPSLNLRSSPIPGRGCPTGQVRGSEGFITLISVVVAGAVGLGIALSILLTSSVFSKNMIVLQQSAQAAAMADACTEEALLQVRSNAAFTGSGALALDSGSCTYLVAGAGSSRTVSATGTVSTVVRKTSVTIPNTSYFSATSTSWQEIGG